MFVSLSDCHGFKNDSENQVILYRKGNLHPSFYMQLLSVFLFIVFYCLNSYFQCSQLTLLQQFFFLSLVSKWLSICTAHSFLHFFPLSFHGEGMCVKLCIGNLMDKLLHTRNNVNIKMVTVRFLFRLYFLLLPLPSSSS